MDQPAWLTAAWAEFGVREVPGAGCEPAVAGYFREAGHGDIRDDEIPWCAAFVAAMLKRGGAAGSGSLLARSYLDWGEGLDGPKAGAVVVLPRGADANAGHAGFCAGAAGDRVFVLGGNQGDAVSVAAFDIASVLGYRWPVKPASTDEAAGPVATEASLSEAAANAVFDIGLSHVLEMEGGFSDDPYDPGRPTNRGITLREFAVWQGVTLDAASRARLIGDLKRIADDTVAAIYRKRYWGPSSCAALPAAVAFMHFDASVNHGVGGAIRMLQAAVGVAVDGEIGPVTLSAVRSQPAAAVVETYADIRRKRYRGLPHFWRFGRGWLRRVDATLAAARRLQSPSSQAAKGRKPMPQDFSFPRPGEIPNAPMAGDAPTDSNGKWWAQSKTIWGVLITMATTVLPVLGPLIGLNIPADVITQIGSQAIVVVQALGGLFGTLLAIYGRTQAAQPLMRRDVKVRV